MYRTQAMTSDVTVPTVKLVGCGINPLAREEAPAVMVEGTKIRLERSWPDFLVRVKIAVTRAEEDLPLAPKLLVPLRERWSVLNRPAEKVVDRLFVGWSRTRHTRSLRVARYYRKSDIRARTV